MLEAPQKVEKPSLLLISHTYLVGEHAKKLPELARHFELTCATTSAKDFGPMYGLEGERFGMERKHEGYTLLTLPAWGSVRSVTRFFMRGLFVLIRSRAWDFVLVENEPWSFLKWQTLLACRMAGNVGYGGEFTWENVKRPGLKGAVLSLCYRATGWFSDFVIAGNQAGAALVRHYGMPARRVFVCPQVGVDVNHYRPLSKEAKRDLRERWGLPREVFLVGFAGRFVSEKGLRDVANALEQARTAEREGAEELHLAMIGHGPLKEELRKRDPENTWLHLREAVPHHELPAFLQCLDVLVLGSHPVSKNGVCWQEQFGHILIEAAACGALAVGSTSGAIPEVLGDAELLFAPGDVEAIRDLILRLATEPAYLEQKKAEQRERLLTHYTHAAVADRFAAFLLSLPDEKTKAPLSQLSRCHP